MPQRTGVSRRRLLAMVSGFSVALSGCLSQSTGSKRSPITSPTNSPTANTTGDINGSQGTSDQTAPPTDSRTATTTPAVESQVEVPPCPEKPDSFTQETALEFATQFEKAYLVRSTIQKIERVLSVDVDISGSLTDKTATQTADGWLVRFSVQGPAYRHRPSPGGTVMHLDPPIFTASYFITDQTVLRATAGKEVDPREIGAEVHCPPKSL